MQTWTKIWTSVLQISSLVLYHLSYPGSIDGASPNFSLESNDMQDIVVCDTFYHHLTSALTLSLFIYFILMF